MKSITVRHRERKCACGWETPILLLSSEAPFLPLVIIIFCPKCDSRFPLGNMPDDWEEE